MVCRDLYRNYRDDVHPQQLLLTGGDISTRQAMDGRSVWEEPPPRGTPAGWPLPWTFPLRRHNTTLTQGEGGS